MPKLATLGATGGLTAGRAALSGLGSLVKGLTDSDLAELATELTLGLKGPKFVRNIPNVPQRQTEAYQKAKGIAPKVLREAESISEPLKNIKKALSFETTESTKNKIGSILDTFSDKLKKGKLRPNDALTLRTNLNETSKILSDSENKKYIEPLRKGLENFFGSYMATHPEYYKQLKSADKLTALKNSQGILEEFADKVGLTKLPYIKPFVGKILSLSGDQVSKLARNIYQNSEARKYYFDVVKSAAKNDPELFVRNLVKLSSNLEPKKDKSIKKIILT